MSDLLNTFEAANFLRLSPHTIRLWVFQKRIPVVRMGRTVRFKREELVNLINQNSQPAVSANGRK